MSYQFTQEFLSEIYSHKFFIMYLEISRKYVTNHYFRFKIVVNVNLAKNIRLHLEM